MGALGDALCLRNPELLRHLNDASSAALLARTAELQTPTFQPPPSPSRPAPKAVAQKPVPSNPNLFQFPWKLHDMLDNSAQEGLDEVVSWQDEGRAFRVHIPQTFVDHIMCRHFKQTKYKSFQVSMRFKPSLVFVLVLTHVFAREAPTQPVRLQQNQ